MVDEPTFNVDEPTFMVDEPTFNVDESLVIVSEMQPPNVTRRSHSNDCRRTGRRKQGFFMGARRV
jgi:hypothetical protein